MTWLSMATGLSLFIWLYLLLQHQGFWRAGPYLSGTIMTADQWPDVVAVVPARNEADVIEASVRSLLTQQYPGRLHVIVVDDGSTDATGAIVQHLDTDAHGDHALELVTNSPRPDGWSGKLWAVATGLDRARQRVPDAAYVLLTDADIAHGTTNLAELVTKAITDQRELVSLMVKLRTESLWERFLIPPFVFFFQMLYPFPAVNDPNRPEAAAAGGCVLVKREALDDVGGVSAIRGSLIDDVALGRLIKNRRDGNRRIWLGLDNRTRSIRAYDSLATIWAMVARTADTQLRHSLCLLAGTVLGLTFVYLLPPLVVFTWPIHGEPLTSILGAITWSVMAFAFWPTLTLYRQNGLVALSLPVAALFYLGMTIDSAWQYRNGRGGLWKGRVAAD